MKKPKEVASPFETYKIVSVIGQGGTGVVYSGEASDGASVAIKCLRPGSSKEVIKRFKNEAFFCLLNRHPNVLAVSDVGSHTSDKGTAPFYVMPKFDGTLRDAIEAASSGDEVLALIAQVLDGVEAAHLKSCWHRDLKPENVLWLKRENRLVVSDFGIAHFAEPELHTAVKTQDHARLANFQYAAPEQRQRGATGTVDRRADIYALGLMINEAFTGQVPQGADYATIGSVSVSHSWLDGIVGRMIQQDPDARHGAIVEVKQQLISNRQQFVVKQRLDSLEGQVVPETTPSETEARPIEITAVDWADNHLHLKLNRAPSAGWIHEYQQPMSGLYYVSGSSHTDARVDRDTIVVYAPEDRAQEILNHHRAFLSRASTNYVRSMKQRAREMDAEERRRLEAVKSKEEARLRVLKNLE